MCYTFGRFLKEEHKAGFYDAAVSFVHPITGLFPHANAGELFGKGKRRRRNISQNKRYSKKIYRGK
ncbi:PTS glucitol/sorbitol transporter subunit IIC [Clostridioides difficile]